MTRDKMMSVLLGYEEFLARCAELDNWDEPLEWVRRATKADFTYKRDAFRMAIRELSAAAE